MIPGQRLRKPSEPPNVKVIFGHCRPIAAMLNVAGRSVAEEGKIIDERLRAALVIFLFSLLEAPALMAARIGPDGTTRVICLGDVIQQYGTYNSFTVIDYDPAIRTTMIPSRPDYLAGYENAYRNMRAYMPRTYSDLIEKYDLILMSDADRLVFTANWIGWLSDSVPKGGLGLLWLGSIVEEVAVGWVGTTLADILPAEQAPGQYTRERAFQVRIVDRDEALMKALPWERTPPLANVNAQIPRDGASLWAELRSPFETHPFMTYWQNGKGAVLNFASKFPVGVQPWVDGWTLFPQAMMYLVYRTADKQLPEDPFLFREVMNSFVAFHQRSSLIDSILDWVEKFGGNPGKLRQELDALRNAGSDAEEAYLAGSFDAALALLGDAEARQDRIRILAMKAKDEAMLWIYLTEWCILMGTFLIASYTLWTLMVRRTLYREVRSSRLEREATW